jgi:hypothetical protein
LLGKGSDASARWVSAYCFLDQIDVYPDLDFFRGLGIAAERL